MQLQHSASVGRGTVAAMTDDDLGREWAEACSLFDSDHEIMRLHGEANSERETVRNMRRFDFRR